VKLVVIGAGFAGLGAIWAARGSGADLVLVHHRPGASALASGALDVLGWERARPSAPVAAEIVELALRLGFVIGPNDATVATLAGVIRPARGREQNVLDLAPLAGRRIGVADVLRDDWDAPSLARAFATSRFARETGTRFEAREIDLLRRAAESRFSAHDFAALHDDPARFERLTRALSKAGRDLDAWLVGPWLGIESSRARALGEKLGVPVGETLSAPAGPAGARFERARDALLADLGVVPIASRVLSLEPQANRWLVRTEHAELDADRVVLAMGGVAAGGIGMDPARPDHPGGARFHASLRAPVAIEIDGLCVDAVSSLFGIDVSAWGMNVLERIGIATDGVCVRGSPGLFAAGDCVAARPRTALEAMTRGAEAARAALASC
jgi:glycerol-3-phosphate dehydrogenase subunit B